MNAETTGQDPAAQLRRMLVQRLKAAGFVRSSGVEAALDVVPRHLFVPDVPIERAYRDEPVVFRFLADGGVASSCSSPSIVATMLEQLAIRPGDRILEIGAGSGYNAALLAELAGPNGSVVTVDIDEDLVNDARSRLEAAGYGNVKVVCADGGYGYPPLAPYDRIILTAASWDIAPAWREQLRASGRLVMPLSLRGPQECVAFEQAEECLSSVSVAECGFMRLRGSFGEPEGRVSLGPNAGLELGLAEPERVDAEAAYAWLTGPASAWAAGFDSNPLEIAGSFGLWLALRDPGYCAIWAAWQHPQRACVPPLFELPGWVRSSIGLLDADGLGVLSRPPDQMPEQAGPRTAFPLWVRAFGPSESAARRLAEQLRAWDAAGRPNARRLRIRAYPADAALTARPNAFVLMRPWTQFVLDWE